MTQERAVDDIDRQALEASALYGVDWWTWSIAAAECMSVSIREIEDEWPLWRSVQAHAFLDVQAAAARRESAKQ